MRSSRVAAMAAALALAGPAALRAAPEPHWIASWGAAQMVPTGDNVLAPAMLTDATLRQTVHLSAGGRSIRVRFSNAFGTQPLVIDAAGIARATATGASSIVPGSAMTLRFGGQARVLIPAGAEMVSDPVAMAVPAGADLAITLHLPQAPAVQTSHPGARAKSFVLAGEHVGANDLPGAAPVERWYQIADVEIAAAPAAGTVVAIGDSITDGHGVVTNSNGRWTDRFAERMRASTAYRGWGVVNAGIGGGRVLRDGIGPNLLARFDRDVIARGNVRVAIVLEGINDIGVFNRDGPATPEAHAALVADMEAGFREIVRRAHAHGIAVVGGTVMPFTGNDYYHPGAASEADRQAVNSFIRASGVFDAVVDFDRVMRNPAHPDRLLPAYDLGDHLHPSPAGYKVMGEAVPLAVLATRPHADAPIASAIAGAVAAVPPAPATPGPTIAFTVDDIPAHGPLPAGVSRLDVARAFTAALNARHVPAFGFVNGGFGAGDPDSPRVLGEWRRAGLPLGNHTFHHLGLSKTPLSDWRKDVIDNEPVIAAPMAGADWHWLRYPFLDEGTPADRDDARRFLADRGYRIAAVTMSFGDYEWNEPYARCTAQGDQRAIAGLEASYLAAARAEALRERARSREALGRDIPYVLLMHIGAFDARMLPRLLDLYRQLGFGFVSLPVAERDPFYRGAIDPTRPGPSPTLPALAGEPALPHPDPALCR